MVVYLYQLSHVRSVYKARQEVKLLFTLLFLYYHYLTGKLLFLCTYVELLLNIISYYHYLTDLWSFVILGGSSLSDVVDLAYLSSEVFADVERNSGLISVPTCTDIFPTVPNLLYLLRFCTSPLSL